MNRIQTLQGLEVPHILSIREHHITGLRWEEAAMTLAGLIVCAIGIAGFLANYTGMYPLSGAMADMRLWVGVIVIGALTAILTRRASD